MKKYRKINDKETLNSASMEFIASGIACYALCLIHEAGILNSLLDEKEFKKNDFKKFNNPSLIASAFVSLLNSRVVFLKKNVYLLTEFGKELAKKIGIITMPFEGYGKLFFKQRQLLNNPDSFSCSDIDFASVAISSIDFGKYDLNPMLKKIFKDLNPKGIICDLGCGAAHKLIEICKFTKSPGLGIDQSFQSIKLSKKNITRDVKIKIERNDITNLKKHYKHVTDIMMCFVCHDIVSKNKCKNILSSYKSCFPEMENLIIVDIVHPSKKVSTIMPGFDYVHGLQGFTPRTYEENLKVFKLAGYRIFMEFDVPNMPNTFIWILKPSEKSKKRILVQS